MRRRRRRLKAERVWIARSVLDQILAQSKEAEPLESGGMLLGYVGVDRAEIVVGEVIGPGPKAVSTKHGFEPDGHWQRLHLERRYFESGRVITYMGDWHSHAHGVALPSFQDLQTARKIARAKEARMSQPLTVIAACEDERWVVAGFRYSGKRFWPVLLTPFEGAEI